MKRAVWELRIGQRASASCLGPWALFSNRISKKDMFVVVVVEVVVEKRSFLMFF